MRTEWIHTPFDNFLIFARDKEKGLVSRIWFSDVNIGAPLSGSLRVDLERVFEERDVGVVDESVFDMGSVDGRYKAVYLFLRGMLRGEVYTYSEVAEIVFDDSRFRRFVALILGKNPFTFLVPCHRVVGKYSIGGYSPGVWLKRKILQWEGACVTCT